MQTSTAPTGQTRRPWLVRASYCVAAALMLSACVSTINKHGHQFQETDIAQIQPGMSQEAVRGVLGTPATMSPVGTGNAFYYIGSTTKQAAFFAPEEVDRKVLAIYFNQAGSVERVAHYGLKDGKVFDFVKRQTPTHVRDEGILQMLFRNLGKKQFFGD